MTKKQFDRLTRAKRRVLIAEDVLRTLALPASRRFKPTSGTYCSFLQMPSKLFNRVMKGDDAELSAVLPEIEKYCHACAMGALLLSHVRMVNQVPLESNFGFDEIVRILKDYFSFDQLDKIEHAFECGWRGELPNPSARLRAICENIVRNHGSFRANQPSPSSGLWRGVTNSVRIGCSLKGD